MEEVNVTAHLGKKLLSSSNPAETQYAPPFDKAPSGPANAGTHPGTLVSLRHLKSLSRRMGPRHPLRVVLEAEPNEISWEEYATKSPVWFRLLTLKED